MTNMPDNLKYAPSHVWVSLDADGLVTIGVTDHVLETLGHINYVELPDDGSLIQATEMCAQLASTYESMDICAPISGMVVETNPDVIETPDIVNGDPFAAWLFRVRPNDATELDALLDSASYRSGCLYFAE